MKILVTGYKGFIGNQIFKYFLNLGYDVNGFEWNEGTFPNLKLFKWVIHCGAISDTTERDVEKVLRQKTLKSFIESHPKGTYIVTVAKHALTVKDGEVMDWNSNKFLPTRKIQGAYKIDSKEVDNQLKLF